MAHKVFICHASKDKQVADAACAALEAQRIPCWIAPRDILAGEEYGKSIVDALSACQIVLLIFSAHANDSPQVRREIERAVSKGKIIVPFRIEDVLPSDAMEFALSNTHWLDALTPPLERYLIQLCDTISRLIQKHKEAGPPLWKPQEPVKETIVKPEPIPEASSRAAIEPPPQRSRRFVWPSTIALLLLLAVFAAWRFWHAPRNLQGHTNTVSSVAFSPDGRTLASGSRDHTIKLWDVASVNK